jgi:hypothetical protein
VIGSASITFTVDVEGLGLGRAPTSALAGGTAAENAAIIESIFAGETGPTRDVVLLNAGAALIAAGYRGRARRRCRGCAFRARFQAAEAAPRAASRREGGGRSQPRNRLRQAAGSPA